MPRAVLDVRAFGAVGDGVADDHAAVVRALYRAFVPLVRRVPRFDPGEGAVLYFPAGTYRIDGSFEQLLVYDDLHVVGDGPGRTTLVFAQRDHHPTPGTGYFSDAPHRLGAGGDPGHPIRRFSIADLTLTTDLWPVTPPRRDVGAAPLSIGWCHGVRVTNVEVAEAANTGIYLYHCRDVVIDRCSVHHVNLDGVSVSRSVEVSIRRCQIHDTGDDGIGVGGPRSQPCRDVDIAGNRIAHAGSNGVSLFGVERAAVTHNQVRDTYMCGITVRVWQSGSGTRDVTITENDVAGAGLHPSDHRPAQAPLWGGGTPYGIAVLNDTAPSPDDPHYVDVPLGPVEIRENCIGACRNSFVAVSRAERVSVAGNVFEGALVAGPRPYDRGEGDRYLEGSGTYDPPAYHGGSTDAATPWRLGPDDVVQFDGNLVGPDGSVP